ncbi:HD domain-containing protein [Candidatus Phytoplasma meliae]|uniref:HD domain-containing protein n=1 Tax=Candidatus Phytoplasma meliae TaxID=1848402 RepID=A0ABS5CYC0_9MOLU|nr:HD domain-containing protein [Candidatus Phytoplasma meliae]MBP5835974.1 HD domain-containing protein [Candidatus Phytoplasma meliae]
MNTNPNIIAPIKEPGKINYFIGKVTSVNQGYHFANINLQLTNKSDVNIKLNKDILSPKPILGQIYCFETVCLVKNTELIFMHQKFTLAQDSLDMQTLYEVFQSFYECAPISFAVVATDLEKYLDKIKNHILKTVTTNLYLRYKNKFLISKAALKIHHNYYGGLGYHTLTMLKMAEPILNIYPFLNSDLLYAGIILHDMAKIQEIDFNKKEYTKEGKLLGHLVMIACDVEVEANLLGYQTKEEILLLKHMLIAHHGLLEYGSAKKPQIGEVLLLWYLDNIDCKLTSLSEMLQKTDSQTFTESIPVLEKRNFYKPLLSDDN